LTFCTTVNPTSKKHIKSTFKKIGKQQ